jgi:hypothetical protein
MMSIKTLVERAIGILFTQKNVDFTRLRTSDQEAYVKEGWGGKGIKEWPVYSFYRAYLNGEREIAYAAFSDWYLDQLRKYHATPKEKGGMLRGSLYTLIVQKYAEKGINHSDDIFLDPSVVMLAIKERVDQRFALLESVTRKGHVIDFDDAIVGIKKKGHIYIVNGHHRWAILELLSYHSIPEVRVFGENIHYLSRITQRIWKKWVTLIGMK